MAPTKFILVIGVALYLTVTSALIQDTPYSYIGATGPDKWGSLSPSYAKCSHGKSQSPINIVKKDLVHDIQLQPFFRNYTATNATLINNGFNIGMSYGNSGGVAYIDGKMYTLKQMHWHTPSEHTIDGQRFAAELHLVHLSKEGTLAVVAILYEYGKADPLLHQMKASLDKLTEETCDGDQEARVAVKVKAKQFSKKTRKYFRYYGSLTVPPCVENIPWTILGKVREISKEQVEALKAPLNSSYVNNSRPLQKLNGRKVLLYNDYLN
ncbi:carbonic anhydrase [Ranunculus cassubicifolius]